jgi:integrase
MKCDRAQIIKLIDQIRAGNPPKPRAGKFEDIYLDPALPCFGIRVLHTGAGSWFVQSKRLGRPHKVTLGDVRVIDRPTAVEAARTVLAKIQLGILDPQAAKREAMRTAKVTFISVVPLFLAKKRPVLRKGSYRLYERILTLFYFQPLHKLPIDEITGGQIATLLDKIATKSGLGQAHNCWTAMNVLFKWAIKTGKLPEGHKNPMTMVEHPDRNGPRDRVLSNEEIARIWRACENWEAEVRADDARVAAGSKRMQPGQPSSVDCPRVVKLLFLTGCRAQEIGDLQWSEVDTINNEIFIPKTRTKAGHPLHIPLSDMAVEILNSVKQRPGNPHVFGKSNNPGKGQSLVDANKKVDSHISKMDALLTRFAIDPAAAQNSRFPPPVARGELERRGQSERNQRPRSVAGRYIVREMPAVEQRICEMLAKGISGRYIAEELHVSGPRIRLIKARMTVPTDKQPKAKPLAHWTVHDIRRTFRTRLSECGVSRDVAEALIGHVSHRTEMDRAYDHYNQWPEKRDAVRRWETKLRAIIDGTDEKVIAPKFRQRRAAVGQP